MFGEGICLTRANLIYYMRLEDAFRGVKRGKSVSKKRPFSRYTFWSLSEGLRHPCLAGLDPASHAVKRRKKWIGKDG